MVQKDYFNEVLILKEIYHSVCAHPQERYSLPTSEKREVFDAFREGEQLDRRLSDEKMIL